MFGPLICIKHILNLEKKTMLLLHSFILHMIVNVPGSIRIRFKTICFFFGGEQEGKGIFYFYLFAFKLIKNI